VLPWDTDFFKCPIARVCGDTLDEQRAWAIDVWCRSNGIQCLYFLARSDNPLTIRTAEAHAFRLVDIRLTLELNLTEVRQPTEPARTPKGVIRPFAQGDLKRLQAMARLVHNNTRFYSDPHLRERVEDFYPTWIAKECSGDAQCMLVAVSSGNDPIGYISCRADHSAAVGQIGLVGVAPEWQGKGIGESLLAAATEWFCAQRLKKVTVVTQGHNRPAQRLYQRCGFLTHDIGLWYHKWFPQAPHQNV
jgi:dTDP-4-amino-4,6-dideoxy-D-galactose acyltransferase